MSTASATSDLTQAIGVSNVVSATSIAVANISAAEPTITPAAAPRTHDA
jgi:hypothetical protein